MSPALTMRRIVLPQAMRVIIPTHGQRDHLHAQDHLVGGRHRRPRDDGSSSSIYSQNFQIIPLLVVACIWYIFFTTLLTIGQALPRGVLRQGLRREGGRGGREERPRAPRQRAAQVQGAG